MRILIWLFFLLITGEAVWAKGPKVLFIGDSITDGNWGNSDGTLPNHLLSAIIGI